MAEANNEFAHWWPPDLSKAMLAEGFCWLCPGQRLEPRSLPAGPAVAIGRSKIEVVGLGPAAELGEGTMFVQELADWGVCPSCGHRYQISAEQIVEQIPLRIPDSDGFVWAGLQLAPPMERPVRIVHTDGRCTAHERLDRFPEDAEFVELVWT